MSTPEDTAGGTKGGNGHAAESPAAAAADHPDHSGDEKTVAESAAAATKEQPFDPNRHEAIQQVETTEVPPGTVADVFARGYMMGDRLLRAAMVAVAKQPAAAAAQPEAGGGDGSGESGGDGAADVERKGD